MQKRARYLAPGKLWMWGWGWAHTRHTTVPHRRHSPTMSRAQAVDRDRGYLRGAVVRGGSLVVCHIIGEAKERAARPGGGVLGSLTQRSVPVISRLRYWMRFSRNWRQVRERSCSELRSSEDASWLAMLAVRQSVTVVGNGGRSE